MYIKFYFSKNKIKQRNNKDIFVMYILLFHYMHARIVSNKYFGADC